MSPGHTLNLCTCRGVLKAAPNSKDTTFEIVEQAATAAKIKKVFKVSEYYVGNVEYVDSCETINRWTRVVTCVKYN